MSRGLRRAVVIGRGGQVATALRESLPAAGFDVISLGRPQIDLLAPEGLKTAIEATEPAIVINAAAYTAVDRAEDERDTAFLINAIAAGKIAAAAAQAGCPIVHFSTDYVFDGSKTTPYVESDPPAPLGAYGASKLAGEQAVAAANPWHVILRTAWVCSPWGHNFVRTMLRLSSQRDVLRVVDDQRGTPTFASDIAEAVGPLAGKLIEAGPDPKFRGIFHMTNAGGTTWCGFARAIMAGARKRGAMAATVEAISTADFPTKARRPRDSKLDTYKIGQIYGIHLPDWQDGLERCLDRLISSAEPERGSSSRPNKGDRT